MSTDAAAVMKSGLFSYDAVHRECPPGYTKVCEGTTAVLEPPPQTKSATTAHAPEEDAQDHEDMNEDGGDGQDQAIFYNPAQVVNRDLSICAIETFSRRRLTEPRRRGGTKQGITILEALSATGLRAIRYYKEITNVRFIIANDMDRDAVDCIVRNCSYNDVPVAYPTWQENMPADAIETYPDVEKGREEGSAAAGSGAEQEAVGVRRGGAIVPNLDDAVDLMHRLSMNPGVHAGQRLALAPPPSSSPESTTPSEPKVTPLLQQELMDVVDLDPYGSASPFLDGAMACIKEGGLMLVTSTDSSILCGNFADTAHAKYNSFPYKASHCHEAAVRVLLACIERAANKHKKYIVPLMSMHIDFYVRCFFRVYTQAAEVKLSACKLGYQLQCSNCPAFWVRPMATARPPRPSRKDRRAEKKEAHQQQLKRRREEGADNGEGRKAAPPQEHPAAAVEAAAHVEASTELGAEVFPSPPNRQSSPKVNALTLQQLPSCADGQRCPVCGSSVVLSGPIYCAPTQNKEYLTDMLAVIKERAAQGRINAEARITGLLHSAMDELADAPLFYVLPDIASYVKVRCPPTPLFVAALARLGYRCSQVHCTAAGLKTDCPPPLLFRVMLQWKALQDAQDAEHDSARDEASAEQTNATESKDACGTAAAAKMRNRKEEKAAKAAEQDRHRALLVTPLTEADFTYSKEYDFRSHVTGVSKFVPNAPGWGPKRRHQGAAPVHEEEEGGNNESCE